MKIPSTTVEFLDALKVARGWQSDYRVAKAMGWSHQTVTSYRTGRSSMSAKTAIRIADELGLPRAYVLACMEAERERNEEVAGVWRELAHHLRGAAAIILIVLGLLLPGPKAQATQAVTAVPADLTSLAHICIMRSMLRAALARLRAWWLRTEYPALQFA